MKALIVCRGAWTVLAMCSDRGDCELLSFLGGLDGDLVKQGDRMLGLLRRRVAEHGPPHNDEVSHKLDGDVWEFIEGRLRVLYFCEGGKVVVCSHALLKKGRKIPRADIERAQRLCDAYREASRSGTLETIGDV
jgi:phage-related protein